MPKRRPSAKWLRFTEEANALDYLQKACEALRKVDRRPVEWKWVVVGLHGALYGFGICAVKAANWERVTYRTKRGHERLISFDETLKRCLSSQWMKFYVQSQPLVLTSEQREAIGWFKKYRNRFEHYVPLHWSIEKHDLPVFAIEILEVIRFLALDSGNVRLREHDRSQVQSWTRIASNRLRRSQLYRDYLAAKSRHQGRQRKK